MRHIGFAHGASFDHVVNPANRVVLAPERGIDEELHFASVNKIGDTYLMLFESDRFSANPIHGDLRLAVSSDGREFRRIHPHTPFVGTGSRGTWDENLLVTSTSSMQEVGDEVYIYYFGCPNVYNSWPIQYAVEPARRGSLLYPSYMGLAVMKRDRYAYAAGHGQLTTHAIEMREGELWVNRGGDGVRVDALDECGQVTARGGPGKLSMQTVYRKVEWAGPPPIGKITLRLELNGDTLYSVKYS